MIKTFILESNKIFIFISLDIVFFIPTLYISALAIAVLTDLEH
jgi:hypothetical protein